MSLIFDSWNSDFAVSAVGGIVSLVAAGLLLAGACWLVGYVIEHLIRILKGGF